MICGDAAHHLPAARSRHIPADANVISGLGVQQFDSSYGVDPNENKHGQDAAIYSLVLIRFFLIKEHNGNRKEIVKKS